MGSDHLLSVAAFCFAGAMTPGPNNLMLLASGVNFGFARTLPHVVGVMIGYCVLLLAVGSGLGQLFSAFPPAYTALKVIGVIYLLWLAWKVASASAANGAAQASRPFTFLEAAAFQWVNVKGVLVAFSAVAAFTRPDAFAQTLFALVAVSTATAGLSAATWALFGSGLSQWLADPRVRRPFNIGMAALLVASLWPMLAGG